MLDIRGFNHEKAAWIFDVYITCNVFLLRQIRLECSDSQHYAAGYSIDSPSAHYYTPISMSKYKRG